MNTRDISDKVREFSSKAQDWQKNATETARKVSQQTDQYVRDNTWTAIAGAAVLGCIVGFLLAGRSDD
jgi:ElaB/YqjD/DUF883 family membrane-anchored ribosome-binding protein